MIRLKKEEKDLSRIAILDIMGKVPYAVLVGVIGKGIQNASKNHFSI